MANEKLRQQIWDSLTLTGSQAVTAGTRTPFFQTPKSATKTAQDTNLTVAGQMPYKLMEVWGIRAILASRTTTPVTGGDVNQTINCMSIEYKKEDRLILEALLCQLPAGGGAVNSYTTDSATNGMALQSNLFELGSPEQYTERDRLQLDTIANVAFTPAVTHYLTIVLEAVIVKNYK